VAGWGPGVTLPSIWVLRQLAPNAQQVRPTNRDTWTIQNFQRNMLVSSLFSSLAKVRLDHCEPYIIANWGWWSSPCLLPLLVSFYFYHHGSSDLQCSRKAEEKTRQSP
jgi:hypothetical protein